MLVAMHAPTLTDRRHLTEIEFIGWIANSKPGERLEYHRGFLALDVNAQVTRLQDRHRVELARVAKRVWWAAERGLVYLVQRRRGPCDYSYFAFAGPRADSASASRVAALLSESTNSTTYHDRAHRIRAGGA
jgi:hypothetical protein